MIFSFPGRVYVEEGFAKPGYLTPFIFLKLLLISAGVIFLLFLAPPNLAAQMGGIMGRGGIVEGAGGARLIFSPASSYQFKSDVTGGGSFSVAHYSVMVGESFPLDNKIRVGLGLSYNFGDYDISNLKGFPVANPWGGIHQLGLGAGVAYELAENWGLRIGSIVQYAGERGADFGESLMYGGMVSVSYRVSRDFLIGFGAAVFYRLEETRVFPAFLVSWKITDRLRLGNAYRVSPAGPAGLELEYLLDKNWQLAVGGAYRSYRFRLDSNGPVPGGIGQNDSWPVYARVGCKLGQNIHFDFYGGAAFGGKLSLEDRGGHEMNSASYNTAPVAGFTFWAAF